MTVNDPRISYLLRQGDTPLILAQRLCAWCGHAPELEIDLALANIGLDLLGQARNFLGYAAELAGPPCSEDSLAFGRDERQFHNLLLAEQPNGGFNDTLVRQFLLDAYHVQLHQALSRSRDAQIAAIAAKSLKEADYHLRFSHGWMIRLGDGNDVSHRKIQQSLDNLWRFTAELFHADALELELAEQGIAVDPRELQAPGKRRWKRRCARRRWRCLPSRRSGTAASKAGTANTSARCWRKCSSCSALIQTGNGRRPR